MKRHLYQGKNSDGLAMDAEILESSPRRFYVNVIPCNCIEDYAGTAFRTKENAERAMHRAAKKTDPTVKLEFVKTAYK